MCGICGKLNYNRHEHVEPWVLHKMVESMYHRGPDGFGEFRSGPIALGHRRLNIIDINKGGQPMCNEDGTIWVVYNGEIYNFRELRAQLENKGHRFKSNSDTEVILHSYEEWGTQCVERFRGMFAFGLWDEKKQLLFLARDRIGIKPLYYADIKTGIVFGSEIKAILADPLIKKQINPIAIDRFLTYGYLPGIETLFDGILKVAPGHFLIVQDGRVSIRQYWDLNFRKRENSMSFPDAVEELSALLRQIIKAHMISDVPVGVLLSGGVDSTGVLRYAMEQSEKPIHTFTIGFEGEGFPDERPYAKLAAIRYGTIHKDITITANDFWEFLPKYIWHMEEPVFEPPAVALYYVSRLAKESGIKVLLSGEGGDEAFGGYQNYRNLLLLENIKKLFFPGRSLLYFLFYTLEALGFDRFRKYKDLVDLSMANYYLSRTETPFSSLNKFKQSLYTKEFLKKVRYYQSDEPTRLLWDKLKGQSNLNCMLFIDTKTWLPDDLLLKADKITMANSVELRVPLLDHQVLEFAASIPESFKIKGFKMKRILKEVMKGSVPSEILQRKKTGFPVPYEKWLKSGISNIMEAIFEGQNSYFEEYFYLDRIWNLVKMKDWNEEHSKVIFCILVLVLWQKTFLK